MRIQLWRYATKFNAYILKLVIQDGFMQLSINVCGTLNHFYKVKHVIKEIYGMGNKNMHIPLWNVAYKEYFYQPKVSKVLIVLLTTFVLQIVYHDFQNIVNPNIRSFKYYDYWAASNTMLNEVLW